jgi:hypothetical protein
VGQIVVVVAEVQEVDTLLVVEMAWKPVCRSGYFAMALLAIHSEPTDTAGV